MTSEHLTELSAAKTLRKWQKSQPASKGSIYVFSTTTILRKLRMPHVDNVNKQISPTTMTEDER